MEEKEQTKEKAARGKRMAKSAAREICYTAMFVAIITVCAWISIPIGEIPITLQTMGVCLAAALLGWKRGAIATAVYILLGLCGVPVFTGFTGGVAKLVLPTGGYIVGGKEYIELIGKRLTAPSIGNEVGSYAYGYRLFYQGLFMAPHTVNQAVKGSLLIGKCMETLGYENFPGLDKTPADITRAIRFDTSKELCDFIQSVQEASPIDSFVTLEPWDMPGYDSKVIMAAGCFVEGASIELSADAPVKEPYTAYFQGGLTYEHCKYALKKMLEKLLPARESL